MRSELRSPQAPDEPVPVLAYATPAAPKGLPPWLKEAWSFIKIASIVTATGAFLLALRFDPGHVSGESPRKFMAAYLALLAAVVVVRCLRVRSVPLHWRVSTAVATPFVLWHASAAYVQLAYLRDGWPWLNVYPDARGPIARTVFGLVWLVVSVVGLYWSRRRARAALSRTTTPRPTPG